MTKQINKLFIFALILVSLSLPSVFASEANASNLAFDFIRPQRRVIGAETIEKQLKTNNRSKVIITLDLDKTQNQRATLHEKIDYLQRNLIGHSQMAAAKIEYVYENIPAISVEADSAVYEFLLSNDLVASIEAAIIVEKHTMQGLPLMGADVYRSSYDGSGVAIAILDSGIDYTHPELGGAGFPNDKVLGGYDFGNDDADPMPVGEGHGTHCAGIAAGEITTYADYIGGVSPGSKLYSVKVMPDNSGSTDSATLTAAIDWCISHQNDDPNNPILAISMSLGGGEYFGNCDGISGSFANVVAAARATGITIFASSGNEGLCDSIGFPACFSGVIAVGAVYDENIGTKAYCLSENSCIGSTTGCTAPYRYYSTTTAAMMVAPYSNSSDNVDLLASSNNAYTADIVGVSGSSVGNYYGLMGGTSAACAYAAGTTGSLQQAAKETIGRFLSPDELKELLTATGSAVVDPKNSITKPLIDLAAAIELSQTLQTGGIKVTILPAEAAQAGARWRIAGSSTWLESGQTASGVLAGSVNIEFKPVSGYQIPQPITAIIEANQTTLVNSNYMPADQIFVGDGSDLWEFPLLTYYHDARTQTIYLAEEIGGECTITALSLDVAFLPGQSLQNFTIRLKHTDISDYDETALWQSEGFTTVYQADTSITQTGWVSFDFSQFFVYNGSQNLLVDISFDNDSWTESGLCSYTKHTQNRTILYYSDSEDGSPLSWANTTPQPFTADVATNIKLTLLGGSGTIQNPYEVANIDQLELINTNPSAHYILTSDIDLSAKTYHHAVIAPHTADPGKGYAGTAFTGSLDGNGKTITGLTIDTQGLTASYLGLFGQIAQGAVIKNLAIEQASITTSHDSWFVGAVCGENYGAIVNDCYADADIVCDSSSWYIGGLVGNNYQGQITNCYALGSIETATMSVAVGGLCGENFEASITNSYAANLLQAGRYSVDVGGLCGYNDNGTITSGFWDIETSTQLTSSGGTWKTTAQMQTPNTFHSAGWNYETNWKQPQGFYPALKWQEIILCADINKDGSINTADFALLASQWLNYENESTADIYFDNHINANDLIIIANQWLSQCSQIE